MCFVASRGAYEWLPADNRFAAGVRARLGRCSGPDLESATAVATSWTASSARGRVMGNRRPAPHQWMVLSALALWLLARGVLMLLHGADVGSRFIAVDDPVVRGLGVVLILSAPALLFRWDWAFVASMFVLGALIIETAVTFDTAASTVPLSFVIMWDGITLVLPIPLLAWLRKIFAKAPQPAAN